MPNLSLLEAEKSVDKGLHQKLTENGVGKKICSHRVGLHEQSSSRVFASIWVF